MIALVVDVAVADVELASDALWACGVLAIEERAIPAAFDHRVELWTSLGDDRAVVLDAVAAFPAKWIVRLVEIDETVADAWRRHATVSVVDDGLVICPAWIEPDADVGPSVTVIRIEPGATFGLGDHPTTVLTLRALRRIIAEGRHHQSVLDVGCGSGVLAIAAARLGATRAEGIDISPTAVQTTLDNAMGNGVAAAINVSNTPLAEVVGSFDIVLANILAPALIDLSADLIRVLGSGATLVISGVFADRCEHVIAAFHPLAVAHVDELNGWAAITLRDSS